MPHIVLINPRFEASYWGLEHALPIFDAKANLPVACLPLLAALTPAEHTVTLIDENVEDIDYDLCASADIVGVTGMIVQRFRMKEIITELKRRGCFVVVGGPWITVQENYFADLADVAFIGEAEETWPLPSHHSRRGEAGHPGGRGDWGPAGGSPPSLPCWLGHLPTQATRLCLRPACSQQLGLQSPPEELITNDFPDRNR